MDHHRQLVWTTGSKQNRCQKSPLDVVANRVAEHKTVIAVVPGLDVWLTQVDAPQTSRSNLEKAVPFLLEEQLSSAVETLHFSLGKRQEDGTLATVVVARNLLRQWLTEIQQLGIKPEALVCEQQLLPWKSNSWTLLVTPTSIIVRSGEESGFSLDPGNLKQGLSMALQEGEQRPSHLHIFDYGHDNLDSVISDLNIPFTIEKQQGEPLSLFANHYQTGSVLNLLQGAFAQQEWSNAWWHPFRWTALLLLVWLIFRGGYAFLEENRLTEHIQTLDQQIESQFRQAFPKIRRVVDPQAQMSQQLTQLRQGNRPQTEDGFLTLMAKASNPLKSFSNVTFQRVRFQDGKLDIFLRVSNLQQLDQIREAIEKTPGISALIQSANKDKDGVEGNLRVFKP